MNNRLFKKIFSLSSSSLVVQQQQQSPNPINDCKANDYQLSYREYRPSGITTPSSAVLADVPKTAVSTN